MAVEPVARAVEPRGDGRTVDDHRAKYFADRAETVEPRIAGKVVRARECHRRRRCQPRAKVNLGPGRKTRRRLVEIEIDPQARRQGGVTGRKRQPQPAIGHARLRGDHGRGKGGDHGAGEARRGNPLGARPHQREPGGDGEPQHAERSPAAPLDQRKPGQHRTSHEAQHRLPLRRSGQPEP